MQCAVCQSHEPDDVATCSMCGEASWHPKVVAPAAEQVASEPAPSTLVASASVDASAAEDTDTPAAEPVASEKRGKRR